MPQLLPPGQRMRGAVLPPHLVALLPEWQERFSQVCPESDTPAGTALMYRIALTAEEQLALVADPNGPYIARHWFCRAAAGLGDTVPSRGRQRERAYSAGVQVGGHPD